MLSFIQFISEGSGGQKALNRKRIALAGKNRPSSWTSDIGARMVYKSGSSILRKRAKNISENTTLKTREDQTNTMKAKALKSAKKLVSRMYSHIKSYSGTEPKKDKLTQAYKHYKDRVEKPVMYDPRYKIKTKSTVTGKEEPMVYGKIPSQGRYERNLNNLGVKLAKQKSAELRQKDRDDAVSKNKRKDINEGNLHAWFSKSKSKDGKSGWVNVVTGGTCASDKPGEGTPKCVSSAKRASMSKAERLSAQRRKKAADPNQQSKSGGAKPTYVKTDLKEADIKSKNSGKKDACYHKVKARYRVWPSAYASGALAKCRKSGSKKWGSK